MKPRPRYKGRPRPMDLRTDIQRQRLARLLLLGMNAEQIARRMGRKPQTIRYAIAQPELLALGHRSLKMTERYAHLAPGHLRSEMTRTERKEEPGTRNMEPVALSADDQRGVHMSSMLDWGVRL